MSHKPQKQIADAKRQYVDYENFEESLWQCVNGGKEENAQLVAHVAAGELDNEQEQK